MWDAHLHSYFSVDSKENPENMILKAIRLGLKGMTFTEHIELEHPNTENGWQLDIKNYFTELDFLANKYKDSIRVLKGVEFGLQPHLHDAYNKIANESCFDFILASTHSLGNIDLFSYVPSLKTAELEKKCYIDYFKLYYDNIKNFNNWDSAAHLDYVFRYGKYGKSLSYDQYSDLIEPILKTIIKKEKSMEVNTAGYRTALNSPNPSFEIIKHYYDLGGRSITLGSDSHSENYIALEFNDTIKKLKEIGFKYITIYNKRIPDFLLI